MFTIAERDEFLAELVAWARTDPGITAAALVGSGAGGRADAWLDLDLALRLAEGCDPATVADEWRRRLAAARPVAADLDLWSGPALYRVFPFSNSLQIDVSFWPADAFASTGGPFQLIFGEANDRRPDDPSDPSDPGDPGDIIGWAWLYALHVRSAMARGQFWRAHHMIEGLRGRVIVLACRRDGLPVDHGRGADDLPAALRERLALSLVVRPQTGQLRAAFGVLVDLLLEEVTDLDSVLAERLRPPLGVLVQTRDPARLGP